MGISDNVKIKKTPLKGQDKEGTTSRRGRSALADKTNHQEPEKVKEQLLDERTSKRSKRTFEGEVDHEREEKKEKKTEENEEEDNTEEKATNDILEGEVKEE